MRPPARNRQLLPVALGCLFAVLGLCVALGFLPARAQSPGAEQPAAPTLVVTHVEDAHVSLGEPKQNFGSDPALRVMSDVEALTADVALLQFDLSALPRGAQVLSATLTLYQTDAPTPNGAQTIFANNSEWKEASVTWRNRPKLPNKVLPSLFTTPQQAGVFVPVDVTRFVRAWTGSGGQPNKGFSIQADSTNGPVERRYGSRESEHPPRLAVAYRLPAVRVCAESSDSCAPVAGAEVYNLDTGTVNATDAAGYVVNADSLALGDDLWVRRAAGTDHGATLYHTTGSLVTVEAGAFQGDPAEMRLVVSAARPLYVRDLKVSAQWYVDGDPALRDYLRDQLMAASNALYDFTDGQFVLGKIEVLQNGEGWADADVHIYANNTLAPKAVVGGSVLTDTPDVQATLPLVYIPGNVSIGSYWNRFRTPPGQVNTVDGQTVPPEVTQDDWSLALAHELGHWLLFLFDTYTDVEGSPDRTLAESCLGSAMGDVYRKENHTFVSSQSYWEQYCSHTEAYARLQGRNEWDTIAAWHPWVVKPAEQPAAELAAQFAALDAAAASAGAEELPEALAPPAPLTTVLFVPPASPPGQVAGSAYALQYQDGEAASGEARAFTFRDGRIFDQGKPPKNGVTLTVAGAQVGDRLCVYDVNDFTDDGETPRHQFGCEVIEAGDAELVMTKDLVWQPAVAIEQAGPQEVRLRITQTVEGPPLTLTARLYPEDGPLLQEATFSLTPEGSATITLNLGVPVPPLFVQIFVDEPDGEPATRREVVTDRGVGGGGAFGPKRLYGGVMVQSPNGVAAFQNETPVALAEGESIAWQSVHTAPVPPEGQQMSGQPYGLDAFPPALADDGQIQIQYTGPAATGEPNPAQAAASLFFWNGQQWEKLPTEVTTRVNASAGSVGETVASAPSRGVGLYALFLDEQALPVVTPTPDPGTTPDPNVTPEPGVRPEPGVTPQPGVTPNLGLKPPPGGQGPDMTNQTFLPLIGAPE